MSTKCDIKLALGGDMYVTLTNFRNKTKVHIRKFVLLPSLFNKNWTYLSATKDGVSLAPIQAETLKMALPVVLKALTSSQPQEVLPISIGQDMFLSYRDWLGEMKTHVREFIPLLEACDDDFLQPTMKGITLDHKQTLKLDEHLTTILSMLQPTHPADTQNTDIVQQAPSASQCQDVDKDHSYHVKQSSFDVSDLIDTITLPATQSPIFKPPPGPKKRSANPPKRKNTKRRKLDFSPKVTPASGTADEQTSGSQTSEWVEYCPKVEPVVFD